LESPQQPRFILAPEFMLPDAQNPPPRPPQSADHQPRAPRIGRKLAKPKNPVLFRPRAVERTIMPKASIHKNRQPRLPKNKIRLPKQSLMPPPPRNPMPPEKLDKRDFR
jgi:hypothetical protein